MGKIVNVITKDFAALASIAWFAGEAIKKEVK